MARVAPEDHNTIAHITFICDQIHDFGDEIYEDLMERDHKEAKKKIEQLIKELADINQSLSDEV